MRAALQGFFEPKNPEKYKGNHEKIFYRSGMEKRFMIICDLSKKIIEWSYEPFSIKYLHPLDNRIRNYIIDFYICYYDEETNENKKAIIEIKPSYEKIKPVPIKENEKTTKKKKEKNKNQYNQALKTYIINLAKWKYAIRFAKKLNIEFLILTEEQLNFFK